VTAATAASWRARRAFWGALSRLKFSATKPLTVPKPTADVRSIVPVPFHDRYPDIPITGVYVADHAPADESDVKVRLFCALQAWLARTFSPMQPGVPPVDADPFMALVTAYPAANRRLYRAPVRPPGYDPVDLGLLAVASPYACYLERVDDPASARSRYRWDLEVLASYACHPGVHSPWAVVDFEPDDAGRALRATRITSALGSTEPHDPEWATAQRLALCAASTHLTLVRHFNWLHLVCGASAAIAMHNCLSAGHPVRTLLQPHLYATHFGNEIVTRIALAPGGDFESIFSYTHDGMCRLFSDTASGFDLRMIHPFCDAEHRGVVDVPGGTPALDNRLDLWRVIHDHVERFMSRYFARTADLRGDLQYARWLDVLTEMIPAGVQELVGTPLTLEGSVELLSTLVYMATVEHEIVDANIFDYQLWNDVQPARVYETGVAEPLDVYQRLVDYNFILSVNRTPLMSEFSSLVPHDDRQGRAAFVEFRKDLNSLQMRIDQLPPAVWRIEPRALRANMNY
jgi:arachidonate 15-lipoxygenase